MRGNPTNISEKRNHVFHPFNRGVERAIQNRHLKRKHKIGFQKKNTLKTVISGMRKMDWFAMGWWGERATVGSPSKPEAACKPVFSKRKK